MNNGQRATITGYRSTNDITVRFEDGTEVITRYTHFISGNVKNPNLHLGETKVMKNGLKATIVGYRGTKDIDVQFEDRCILTHRQYSSFSNGTLLHPKLGETRVMNCGKRATIIVYRSCKDIDIQFEDGTIVAHKHYSGFRRGKIACANRTTKKP